MALNIKKESAHARVKYLASLTGESLTKAVEIAVEERIERVEQAQGKTKRERIHAIAEDMAKRFRTPDAMIDHDELLYDEYGLPK
jgi:antitoxin VapB